MSVAEHPEFTSGKRLFTPDNALGIIQSQMYAKQRKINTSHLNKLCREMKDGTFSPVANIMFATVEGEDERCINGNHTLSAIVKTGIQQCLPTTQYDCATEDQRSRLYFRIDRQRKRDLSDSIRALGMDEVLNLQPFQIKMLVYSFRYIKTNWGVGSNANDLFSDDYMLSLTPWWADDCRNLFECVSPCSSYDRGLLTIQSVMPVALVTMHYQKEKAMNFWRQYVQDDGLGRYDPRKKARIFVKETKRKTDMSFEPVRKNVVTRGVIIAWNRFYDGDQVVKRIVSKNPTKIVEIKGTPYTGHQAADFLPEWGDFDFDDLS